MELVNIKTVYDMCKKIIIITELQEYFKIDDYPKFAKIVKELVANGTLSEVKSSKLNGMDPPLYNKYRVNQNEEDLKHLEEEIIYNFPLEFGRDFYLKNLKKYETDREYIISLGDYFRNNKNELYIPMSMNERSFSIWGIEKFLKDGNGQNILKNLGLSLEGLNVYTTPEPFVYFSSRKEKNQKVLIIENKDTWYTIRKLMIDGQSAFLGESIDTIIYGSGKNIEKALEEYEYTVEPYLLNPLSVLYWGDIDYEGIGIYERLKKRYSEVFDIKIFDNAYIAMINLAEGRVLPVYSDKQNKNIDSIFLEEMGSFKERILKLLQAGLYIPQEIINYRILKEE
ncbi:hypothetical protein GKZ28_23135 [Clostridium chromiireducens]|uniref:Wadjet protein JetD C-terminal domain-containing protein n=1 Tax=Clostridium chromiireducens TaxID=225345 RepID=A0A964RRT5_9CLOT|nr:Wadjet anti-phage system protein JetD domain-containing protein [Clostridium chromiireducens]MVX66567.1 hypothetical protein [Clostridium chromiireducens]